MPRSAKMQMTVANTRHILGPRYSRRSSDLETRADECMGQLNKIAFYGILVT